MTISFDGDILDIGFPNDSKKFSYDLSTTKKYRKVSPNVFKSYYEDSIVAFDYSDGLAWLLGNFNTSFGSTVINTMDSVTDNGTWSVADNGTNLQSETRNYLVGSGAVSCDMSPAGTTLSIVNSTMDVVDVGTLNKYFVWVYLPSYDTLTSITLLYGSDGSNYFTTTATTPFSTSSFNLGWNLIAFDKGTETGTVDTANVDYIKLSLNFSSAPSTLTGFLFDSLLGSLGHPVELTYYSRFGWKNSTGTWMQDSTSNDDILNATELEYNVWLNKCAYEAAKAIPLSDGQITMLKADYLEAKNNYFNKYPSRRIKEQNYIYRPSNVNKR